MEISHQGEPVSPMGQLLDCSDIFCLYIFAFLEFEIPIGDLLQSLAGLQTFLANPRHSSIMVRDEKGVKRWKQVQVTLEDHIVRPELFSSDMTIELCTERFNEYVSNIAMEELPRSKPLWQFHIITNPINTVIVKLHHSIGDGYTLMSILLSCLRRADDPSPPLTFPSLKPSKVKLSNQPSLRRFPSFISSIFHSVAEFGWSLLKSSWVEDDISPIRSKNEGVKFRPAAILNITFSLQLIKEIKSKLGVTVNDVISGTILYGIRLYLSDIDNESKTKNCTLLTFMSTREVERYKTAKDMQESKAGKDRMGNQAIYLHVSIPKLNETLISDPLQFVWKVHRQIKRKRHSFAPVLIKKLLQIQYRFKGPEGVAKRFFRTFRNTSVAVSNIVGPVDQMAFENYPIKSFYFTASGLPQSVVITIMSYNGKLTVTIRTEADFIDHPKLASHVNDAFEMIRKAALEIPSN